ncbi:hypothetical protein JTB14_036771 [Gonioctena quinquepunctata]|nr:hypothetical protein JTB14_036771 [Gonioctena quinquepunctata]
MEVPEFGMKYIKDDNESYHILKGEIVKEEPFEIFEGEIAKEEPSQIEAFSKYNKACDESCLEQIQDGDKSNSELEISKCFLYDGNTQLKPNLFNDGIIVKNEDCIDDSLIETTGWKTETIKTEDNANIVHEDMKLELYEKPLIKIESSTSCEFPTDNGVGLQHDVACDERDWEADEDSEKKPLQEDIVKEEPIEILKEEIVNEELSEIEGSSKYNKACDEGHLEHIQVKNEDCTDELSLETTEMKTETIKTEDNTDMVHEDIKLELYEEPLMKIESNTSPELPTDNGVELQHDAAFKEACDASRIGEIQDGNDSNFQLGDFKCVFVDENIVLKPNQFHDEITVKNEENYEYTDDLSVNIAELKTEIIKSEDNTEIVNEDLKPEIYEEPLIKVEPSTSSEHPTDNGVGLQHDAAFEKIKEEPMEIKAFCKYNEVKIEDYTEYTDDSSWNIAELKTETIKTEDNIENVKPEIYEEPFIKIEPSTSSELPTDNGVGLQHDAAIKERKKGSAAA